VACKYLCLKLSCVGVNFMFVLSFIIEKNKICVTLTILQCRLGVLKEGYFIVIRNFFAIFEIKFLENNVHL